MKTWIGININKYKSKKLGNSSGKYVDEIAMLVTEKRKYPNKIKILKVKKKNFKRNSFEIANWAFLST